jgi:hypothetical protein
MLDITRISTQDERINFGFNEIRNIVKNTDPVIQDRPGDVLGKFPSARVEKYGKGVRGSNFPIALRLGFH